MDAGTYLATYEVKVFFYIKYFSAISIITHWFYFDNYKVKLDIGYDMMIFRYPMGQPGVLSKFKVNAL